MQRTAWIVFLLIILLALALRLVTLEQRPMHTDEAVHAIKFASLLEKGSYRYDPFEYHGPALNYITLIPAWLESAQSISEIDETTLRLVPAIVGLLAVVLAGLLYSGFPDKQVLWIAFFLAISPALVYFSRYYIQEILLVTLIWVAILSLYRYHLSSGIGWMIAAGAAVGLAHASKETVILNVFAMILAWFFAVRVSERKQWIRRRRLPPEHLMIGVLTALVVSALFFSSFLQYPQGIADSCLTFKSYLQRGVGAHSAHLYPWYQYFRWLLYNPAPGMMIWSEGFFVLFGTIGLFYSLFRSGHDAKSIFYRFIALYTLVLILLYSLIPYKTPWSMLSFYFGFVVLSVRALTGLWHRLKSFKLRVSYSFLVVIMIGFQGWQCYALNFRYKAHPSNPYVYGHTSEDIFTLVEKIDQIARVHPRGKEMYIEVVCPNDDYWPLPWYLRSYPNAGYWSDVSFETPPAPLIVASPKVENRLLQKLYSVPEPGQRYLYVPLFNQSIELRAGVEIRAYSKKSLFDLYRHQSEETF
ncbi:TIGR03663 family protein [candidate division KSB1 bacterium]|nr:TIGR03663 family protein [candidate division KSB1 bacterium]